MDRLIALLGLRLKLSLRGYLRARETLLGVLVALPGMLLVSGLVSAALFFGLRAVARAEPEAVLAVVSTGATAAAFLVALAPLLTGIGLVEAPDAARLAHLPVPLTTVVLASTLANLVQPAVLAQGLLSLAVALALAESAGGFLLAVCGVALTHLLILQTAQLVGLLLHGLARNRRLLDLVLVLTLPLGLLVGLLPFLLFAGGPRVVLRIVHVLTAADPFAFSPFAWGLRAAVYGGHGELAPFGLWSLAALFAFTGAVALCAFLLQRIHRSAWDLGGARGGAPRVYRPWPLPGPIGALIEKDLRAVWREPAAKASLLFGLLTPFLLLAFLVRGGDTMPPAVLVPLALFAGLAPLGANVFGLERRGIQLLFSFPVPRGELLLAKNLVHSLLRAPSAAALGLVILVLAPWHLLPPAALTALVTWLIAAGMDNLHSILFPITLPGPDRDPYAHASGGRGLGAALVGLALLPVSLVGAAPFVFLAWLPYLLEKPALLAFAWPLALAGAGAVYALLVGGAARLLTRREPDVAGRILGDL